MAKKKQVEEMPALPQWHFVAKSAVIEFEEKVFTQSRLTHISKMVLEHHKSTFIKQHPKPIWKGKGALNRINSWKGEFNSLKVSINPINR